MPRQDAQVFDLGALDAKTGPYRFRYGLFDISIGGTFDGVISIQKFIQGVGYVTVETFSTPVGAVGLQADENIEWRAIMTSWTSGTAKVTMSQDT